MSADDFIVTPWHVEGDIDYDKLIKPVVLFDADIVIGTRLKGSQITRVSYFWHKIGNILISTYFNILYGTTFTDIYSCYVLYKKDLVDPTSLKKHGWDQQAEIICEIVANGSKWFNFHFSNYLSTFYLGYLQIVIYLHYHHIYYQ